MKKLLHWLGLYTEDDLIREKEYGEEVVSKLVLIQLNMLDESTLSFHNKELIDSIKKDCKHNLK